MIPLSVPNFEGNEMKYVTDAVSQGWVSTAGAYVTKLEEQIAEFVHVKEAVACQSGTAALHLALLECGVKRDDLVIVPTLTFIAAVNPVRYLGADPVFMDCDDSLCMDPEKLQLFCERECHVEQECLIHNETGRKVSAIVVVHVFGNLAEMEKIMDITHKYHLKVVEDATEALGTRYTTGKYADRYAGTIGDFGAYSFNGNKIISTGGGGMIVGQESSALKHIQYLSTQAKDDPIFYVHDEIGFNYRMTNIQAAMGVGQMEMLEEFIARKNKNYDTYFELLKECRGGKLLAFREGTYSNKWFYSLQLLEKDVDVRQIVKKLSDYGIQTRPIWGLIHEQKPYCDDIAYQIEKAVEYSKCIINLPCSTNLKQEEIEFVCKNVMSICG